MASDELDKAENGQSDNYTDEHPYPHLHDDDLRSTSPGNGNNNNENNDEIPIKRTLTSITRSTTDSDVIYIGHLPVKKSELFEAFGGTLQPGLQPIPTHRFANPAPLGLSAFALTTFVLSLFNAGARNSSNSKVVLGLAYFYGGVIQLCAGMWEMAVENTFGATALSSYGGFWLAYAAIQTDAFGIVSSYTQGNNELNKALGFFLFGWFIFTFILMICTVKSTLAFFSLFLFLDVTFLLLAISHMFPDAQERPHHHCTKAAGYFGIFTAFIAWYNAYAGIATKENTFVPVKPISLPWSEASSVRKYHRKNR